MGRDPLSGHFKFLSQTAFEKDSYQKANYPFERSDVYARCTLGGKERDFHCEAPFIKHSK